MKNKSKKARVEILLNDASEELLQASNNIKEAFGLAHDILDEKKFEELRNDTSEELLQAGNKITEAFCFIHDILENKEKEIEELKSERKKYLEEWTDLTANEYQKAALRTANRRLDWKNSLIDGMMGLNGEAGECIDILKKHLYQGHELNREALVEELGDVTWYIALIANALGVTMDDVMRTNLIKLQKRYPDGFSADRSVNRKEYGNESTDKD